MTRARRTAGDYKPGAFKDQPCNNRSGKTDIYFNGPGDGRPREQANAVITMTASEHSRGMPPGARGPAFWRAVRAAARALRHIHNEQVFMWECMWRASRVPVDRAGPLAWEPSLDGPRLTGSHLPVPPVPPFGQ